MESFVLTGRDVAYAPGMLLCTSCGASAPTGARFCPSCGSTLGLPQPEERRIVTVLFADLVGFTALSEHMDPEQVKRLVDSCFECLVEVVLEFGGRVDKLLGDGMLVLFGAPVAHEDDPERAVRAALRMHEVLTAHTASSGLAGSDGIRIRVGINTGEVLVGTLAGTDYTVMGDVVNTASRLQAAAPPGRVLVGPTTYALTSHSFEYEPAGELLAKGREQLVTAWLPVQPTAPPGTRRRRRRDVPIVGREAELILAQAALDLVDTTGRSLLFNVNGENGLGKSRLVDEVIALVRTRENVAVLEGACVPYGEANVWFPIAIALASYLDLEPGVPLEAVRSTAIERVQLFGIDDSGLKEQLVDVFAHLMGYPSPIDKLDAPMARSTIHHAVRAVLETRSQLGPLVLSIDDLHWADPVLIDLLEHLVAGLARYPFVLITAMRPGGEVVWPPRTDRSSVVSLTLQPLSRTETEHLANELLQEDQPDQQLLAALFDRSGGNPLFLIELVALTEAGGGNRELPDSLRTLIAARLDQLTIEQRQALENAAVLGTSGMVAGLEKFAVEVGQTFDIEALEELDDLGLMEVRGRRWEFRSESVRDAAYQTLTKAARAQRHAGVARALTDSPAGIDDRAHHAATAAELVQELGTVDGVQLDIAGRATELLTVAADRALDSGSLRMAVRHATRALDLADPAGTTEAELAHLRLVRATASIEQRAFEAAAADIAAMQELATRLGDTTIEAEAHRLRGMLANVSGDMDEARKELGLAVDLLRHADRPDLLASALRIRGFIEMFGGSMTDAEWFFGEADNLYHVLGDERGMAYIEQHRAWIAFLSGDLTMARQRLGHAATTLGNLGDRNGVGWAIGLLAFIEFFEGHFDVAESLAEVVRGEADRRGDEWAVGMMETLVADLRLWQGKLDEAFTFADRARNRFKRLNDRFGLIQSLAPLVRVQVALGKTAAAQRSSEELLALADTGQHGPFPLLAVAGAAMHRGQGAAAEVLAQRALIELKASGGRAFEPTDILALALAQQGRVEEALVAIESVPEFGADHPFTRAVAALMNTLNGRPAEAMAHADAVTHSSGVTYLDEVLAYLAAAGAAAQMGDPEHAALSAQAAVARAMAVGDVVAFGLATSAYVEITGKPHPAHDPRAQLADGWANIVGRLCPQATPDVEAASGVEA